MRCEDIRRLFSESFDDRLDAAARMRFETHTASCPDCAAAYVRYETLFGAVAALPAIDNESPVPYPETARVFRKPELPVSPLRRAATAAAVILVLLGIGSLAFEAGRRGLPPGEDLKAPLEVAEVVLPDYEAQKRIRLVENGARNVATLAEIAPSYSDGEMVRVLDHASGELERRSRLLLELEADRLGSFHDEFRRTAGSLGELCLELNARLEADSTTELRLRQARDLVRRRDLDTVIVRLANFGRSLPETELTAPVDGDAYTIFLAGLDQLGRRDAPGALQFFEVVREAPTIRNSRLNELTLHVERFIRREVGGPAATLDVELSSEPPQVLPRALRVYRIPRQGIWISSSMAGEARFVVPGQASGNGRIIVRPRQPDAERRIEIEIRTPETQPSKRKL